MNEYKKIRDAVKNGDKAELTVETEGKSYKRLFIPPERLIILGGGHIALPLCKMASMLDFETIVVDDRPSFANTARFPEAAVVICNAFKDAIRDLRIRSGDFVCVITRGHRWDGDCLRTILKGIMPHYLGMIGSKRRTGGLLNLLKSEGYPEKFLNEINTPIGVEIGAVTPAEIAVSICAELVSFRNREKGDYLEQTNADMALLDYLADSDEPKSLAIVLSSSGSTPVKPGSMMAVNRLGIAAGTIGGGCSEAAVMGKARSIIGTGNTETVEVDMTNDIAGEEGMVCGGRMTVLVSDISNISG
ncbi:MAG: XdhC family protein [Lachnospiraceae bacterium]|jgi:xanthine dehydrogenase accessory factor